LETRDLGQDSLDRDAGVDDVHGIAELLVQLMRLDVQPPLVAVQRAESAVRDGFAPKATTTTVSAAATTSTSLRKNDEVVLNGNSVSPSATVASPEFGGLT
jgi:hypothetical protein